MNGSGMRGPGMQAAVFLDKDGTLIEDVPNNADPARVVLAAGAGAALRRLQARGLALVVVSNQAGVAHGLFDEAALDAVRLRIGMLLRKEGVRLAGFYYCPHHPGGRVPRYAWHCGCRKPQPGMLLAAARALQLDLLRSWMLGDILDDVEAGHRAGCRAILLDNGHETEWRDGPGRRPDHRAASLAEAADLIERELSRCADPQAGTRAGTPGHGDAPASAAAQAGRAAADPDGAQAGWAERRRGVRPAWPSAGLRR